MKIWLFILFLIKQHTYFENKKGKTMYYIIYLITLLVKLHVYIRFLNLFEYVCSHIIQFSTNKFKVKRRENGKI